MDPILELLVDTLIERLAAAGFEVPASLTQKQRESFVIEALEEAEILPAGNFARLIAAAREVVNSWETGDFANAVRKLDLALPEQTLIDPLAARPER